MDMSTRKITTGLLMSLDGVVESPNVWGWGRYFNDEMKEGIAAGIANADTVLLGRRTYLEFAELWPKQSSDVLMADFLNNSPKYVVSTTLREPLSWKNSRLINGDVADKIRKLKQQPGKDIMVPGSPTLVRWLLNHGLLDELNLSICPIVVGNGARLFEGVDKEVSLKLVASIALKTGVLGTTYAPVRADRAESPETFPAAASSKGGRE
jgi:dihydrofolate reductase